ncbi:MAG TPA: hypothetical protein VEY95_14090 [Azospirillaceae bacterium]|nr:hypothetical protein [Azospirillaceae bacterium]
MPVQAFNPTDLSQSATNWAVAQRLVGAFAPHAQVMPNMTLAIDPGHLLNGTDLLEVNAQSVGPFAATPSQRVDRVVIDRRTGAASIVKGTDGSIQPPVLPAGVLPVARVHLLHTTTAVTNEIIVDERVINPSTSNEPVICRAYPASDQACAGGTDVLVRLSATEFDLGGSFDTATHRFMPKAPGYYRVFAILGGAAIPPNTRFYGAIYKNGKEISTGLTFADDGSGTQASTNTLVYLDGKTDYLQVIAHLVGTTQTYTIKGGNGGYYTRLEAFRISPPA